MYGVFADQALFPEANAVLAEMVREKIRAQVHDPEVAQLLCPTDHPFGTKHPCLDTGYYATFNRPNVSLVDLRTHPIQTITETGIALAGETMDFDAMLAKLTGARPPGPAEDLRSVYQKLGSRLQTQTREIELTALVGLLGAMLVVAASSLSVLWFGRIA